MIRPLLVGIVSGAAAWLIASKAATNRAVIPAEVAAAKLQDAWSEYRTVA